MKYLRLFENFNQSEIDEICRQYKIENYTINPDGSIDVDGDVTLNWKSLTKLPLKFNKVSGYFLCTYNKLTSLDGCPNYVGKSFFCQNNELTNLIGAPIFVADNVDCSKNNITNLIGAPIKVGNTFNCSYNELTSLDGYPKEVGYISDYIGNPIYGIIYLFYCNVKIYLEYQETYNFLRKDCKIVKHLLIEALKDYNEYYNRSVELPKEIKGYTYI
jgi:hypothetical protein